MVHAETSFWAKFMKPACRPELSEIFFALSDPTRLEAVQLLGRGARRASDLAEDLGASRPSMSRHLGILRDAQIVRELADPEDGRARLLALDPEAIEQIGGFVEQMSCNWNARLDSFRALAEQRAPQKSVTKKGKRAS